MVQLAPAAAMDEVTFRSDTVLSDVHLYTPNHRHLMVRLNSVGQPVFLSQFKLLWSQDSRTDSGATGGDHGDVHTRSLLLPRQAAQGPLQEVAAVMRVSPSRPGLTLPAGKRLKLSWMRMGIWTW